MLRKSILTLIGILSLAFGTALLLSARAYIVKKYAAPFVPQSPNFVFNAPSRAITGELTDEVGDVMKIPRDSTVSAEVKSGDLLLVAETLTTHGKSSVVAHFGDSVTATLSAWSEFAYSAGLPENLLLVQDQGTINYSTTVTSSLGIRVWHALISNINGEVSVTLNPTRHTATVKVLSGSVSIAMIDKNNQTHVLNLTEKQTGQINDTTRLLTLMLPQKKSVSRR